MQLGGSARGRAVMIGALTLASLLTACEPSPTPSGSGDASRSARADASAGVIQQMPAGKLPADARETGWSKLFGSSERIVAYQVGTEAVIAYCIQHEGLAERRTACEDVSATGDVVLYTGRSGHGRYLVAIDPQGRIGTLEVEAGGCRWANRGQEDGHWSWVEYFPEDLVRFALTDITGERLAGAPLAANLDDPAVCAYR